MLPCLPRHLRQGLQLLRGTINDLESVESALGFDNVLRYHAAFSFEICPRLIVRLGLVEFEGFDRHVHLLVYNAHGVTTHSNMVE